MKIDEKQLHDLIDENRRLQNEIAMYDAILELSYINIEALNYEIYKIRKLNDKLLSKAKLSLKDEMSSK